MTDPRNYHQDSSRLALIISIGCIVTLTLCALLIGFRYETKKFKALLATIVLILAYQFFFADIILMFVKAAVNAYSLHPPWIREVNPIFIGGSNRKEYLKRRIRALKAQLKLGPTFYKRNEAMTLRYKRILNDIILFGSYFVLLMTLSIGMRDTLMYYNTRTIKDILEHPKFSPYAADNINQVNDLYNFINGTIVKGFINGLSYNNKSFGEAGWVGQQIAKVLGVVRLRQLRHAPKRDLKKFTTSGYGPAWVPDDPQLPYKDKFWHIFQPWTYQTDEKTGGVTQSGKLYDLPGGGYVALLGRNAENCYRILDFLKENNWTDSHTAVVITEFTLYNVDADVFTLVTVNAEQTAFDSFVVTCTVNTLKLLFNVDNIPWYVLLLFVLYFLVLMRIVAYVVLKMWYSSSIKNFFSSNWNCVDVVIVALNIGIVISVFIREVYVKRLLQQLETSKKNEFVPFNRAASIDETCTVLVAFLVALTTIRLWKILQFARVFRVLTDTLNTSKVPLLSTTYFVAVFLTGIGLGAFIINGSNSEHFAHFLSCITSLLSMSFGFTVSVQPTDLNYGGGPLGFALYLILTFTVSIFLMNMFITIVCSYFSKSKEEDKEVSKDSDDYSFWHFLVMEVEETLSRWGWHREEKVTKNRTKEGEADTLRLRGGGSIFGKPKDNSPADVQHEERINLIAEILDTQMELLHETLGNVKEDDFDSSEDESGISNEQDNLESVKVHEEEKKECNAERHNEELRSRKTENQLDVQPKSSSVAIRSF